jgi:hypothetical protein
MVAQIIDDVRPTLNYCGQRKAREVGVSRDYHTDRLQAAFAEDPA